MLRQLEADLLSNLRIIICIVKTRRVEIVHVKARLSL